MTVETREPVDQRGSAYRTHLAVDRSNASQPISDGFMDDVEHQLAAWLRSKDLDLEVRHDNDLTADWRSVEIVHHEGGHGKRHIMATLVEDTPIGQWRTELLGSSDGWINLNVSNSEGRFASVPNLGKYLLEALPIGDGGRVLSAEPRRIHPGDIDQVVDAVFDQSRRGLVFVCGTSHEHDILEPFYERVPRWTREVYGLGQVFVLTPEATEAFNEMTGVFGTMPWSIRTYYPHADRQDLQDSRRHRYLTTASLARLGDGRISKILGTIARAHASTRVESVEVTRVRRVFDRLTTHRLSEAVLRQPEPIEEVIAPPTETPVESPPKRPQPVSGQLIDLVSRVLGITQVTEEALLQRLAKERDAALLTASSAAKGVARRLEQQQEEIWRLEDESKAALDLLEEAAVDESDLRDRVDRLDAEASWLRQRLQSEGEHEAAFTPYEGMESEARETAPENLLELVGRLTSNALPHVVFCGSEGPVEHVVSVDSLGNAARAAWEVCRSLNDYARVVSSNEFSGSVDHYLRDRPAGCHAVPVKKHARGETTATMNQYGGERVFPVPPHVDAGGKTTMEAHFKLASIGMISPRLYYLDRAQVDGRIYIGYIGRHLHNTQSN